MTVIYFYCILRHFVRAVYAFLRVCFYLSAILQVQWPCHSLQIYLNSFHVHVLTYIVAIVSFFYPLLSNIFSMYADLGKNKMID